MLSVVDRCLHVLPLKDPAVSTPSPILVPVHTANGFQVSHGLANLQGVQDKSHHLQGALVLLEIVSQLQWGEEKS